MENNECSNNDIMVSVICIAYNHAPYIKDALNSIVNQKTNFKFEIIVHDDASSDGTADIVRDYAQKYPGLFVPILQKENMCQKKIKINPNFIYPAIRGKYVAFCEGDDYWTDEYKLQKQIDFLEKHPEYSACTHAHKQIDMRDNTETEIHSCGYTGTVTTSQVIEGDGDFFATNSVVALAKHVVDFTPFRANAPVGDYPLIISLAFKGKIYNIDEVMSCYRFMVPGSWTATHVNSDDLRVKKIAALQKALEEADRYSEYKYHDSFRYVIDKKWFNIYIKKYPLRKIKKEYSAYYKTLTSRQKLAVYLSKNFRLAYKIAQLLGK